MVSHFSHSLVGYYHLMGTKHKKVITKLNELKLPVQNDFHAKHDHPSPNKRFSLTSIRLSLPENAGKNIPWQEGYDDKKKNENI